MKKGERENVIIYHFATPIHSVSRTHYQILASEKRMWASMMQIVDTFRISRYNTLCANTADTTANIPI